MADQSETPQIDAEKIKAEAVEAAKNTIISQLQGNKPRYSWEANGKDAPSNYDELMNEIKHQVPTLTEEEVREKARDEFNKLESEKESRLKKQREDEDKLKTKTIEDTRKAFDQEWYDLVKTGKMPSPSAEVQKRIDAGEQLTREEILADEGLKARLELVDLAKTTGKSAKLAFYEEFGKEPPGATAPVLGARPSANQPESEELDYEDVKKSRKKWFGF